MAPLPQPNYGNWPVHARQWALLGPPFRPSPEDVAFLAPFTREPYPTPPRAVLLGVTPEIATLPWPAGTDFAAVDQSQTMIDLVFPTTGTPPGARAILGDWRMLPFEDGTRDIVLGDAVATVLVFPRDTAAVFTEAARVLRTSGRLVVRAFVAPAPPEPPETVVRELAAGRIGGINAFRMRFLMALHESSERGTHLGSAWRAWNAIVPDPLPLFARVGWSAELLKTIDLYRNSSVVYVFPSIEELDAIAQRAGLVEPHVRFPRYELGERCPTIVWRKR